MTKTQMAYFKEMPCPLWKNSKIRVLLKIKRSKRHSNIPIAWSKFMAPFIESKIKAKLADKGYDVDLGKIQEAIDSQEPMKIVDVQDGGDKVEIFVEQEGRAVKVVIKDTGIGIRKGEAKELFKKFVRGEGVAQVDTGGSGLGLFIAKKITEAHNGKIWAESAGRDMGSSFTFTLPME